MERLAPQGPWYPCGCSELDMTSLDILIADDQEPVRRGLRSLIESRPDWKVCGEAADGKAAVAKAKELQPDVILMDVSMPEMNGLDAARLIRQEVPACKILIVSQNDPDWMKKAAVEVGAKGFVHKCDAARDLLRAIEALVKNGAGNVPEEGSQTTRSFVPVSLVNVRGTDHLASDTRERADEHGRASNLLAAIVDSSDDAIISKNLDGIITSWNKSAERLFGYTANETIGQHITLIIPRERWKEEDEFLRKIRRGERVDHFETVRVRKNGATIDLSLTISPVKDASGRVVGASKVARDISERKQNEQALSERALLLDLSNDAIFVRDASDRITYWNKGASELYQYSREEALGRVSHQLLGTEFPEPLKHIIKTFQRDGRWAGELVHRRKDGTQITVASRWALDKDDYGNRKCVLETNNDITQQKQNDKALRESEERLRKLSETLDTEVRARTTELEERNREVLRQSEQVRDLSWRLLRIQDDERRHIARELHDSAGQTLTVLGMGLAQLVQNAGRNAPELATEAEMIQETVQQLHREIRTASYLLHPPLLDETGLFSALSWYVQGLTERSGLDLTLYLSEEFGRLPHDMELVVFRLVQECLTNIHRHSGSKAASIRIVREGNLLTVDIQDQGKGMSAARLAEIQSKGSGVGIRGMRERLRQFQGTLNIESGSSGTRVMVTIPIPKTGGSTEQSGIEPQQALV